MASDNKKRASISFEISNDNKWVLTFNLNEHIDVGYCNVVDGAFAKVVSLVAIFSIVYDQSTSTLTWVGAESTIVLRNYNKQIEIVLFSQTRNSKF